jgi:hypothetical protein
MSEGDIGRIFDRIEEMARAQERQHREVIVKLAEFERDKEYQAKDMAEYQEAISTLHDCVHAIKLERAGEKGKIAGIIITATIAGNVIMAILSRTGVIGNIFGG